jgi:tetratricopeptide (TPR) repeat protein
VRWQVLSLHLGEAEAARAHFRDAAEAAAAVVAPGQPVVAPGPEAATIVFNLSQLHEAAKETAEAERLSQGVLQGHPEYVECHLHTAKAEAAKGDLEAAIAAAMRALEAKANHPEALAMLGSLHMAATRWGEVNSSACFASGPLPAFLLCEPTSATDSFSLLRLRRRTSRSRRCVTCQRRPSRGWTTPRATRTRPCPSLTSCTTTRSRRVARGGRPWTIRPNSA